MTRFRFSNVTFGGEIGIFSGDTVKQALDELAKWRGYQDYAEMCADPSLLEGRIAWERIYEEEPGNQ